MVYCSSRKRDDKSCCGSPCWKSCPIAVFENVEVRDCFCWRLRRWSDDLLVLCSFDAPGKVLQLLLIGCCWLLQCSCQFFCCVADFGSCVCHPLEFPDCSSVLSVLFCWECLFVVCCCCLQCWCSWCWCWLAVLQICLCQECCGVVIC